jgi:hypothetical protein
VAALALAPAAAADMIFLPTTIYKLAPSPAAPQPANHRSVPE